MATVLGRYSVPLPITIRNFMYREHHISLAPSLALMNSAVRMLLVMELNIIYRTTLYDLDLRPLTALRQLIR